MSGWNVSPLRILAEGGVDGVVGHLAIDSCVALSYSSTSLLANSVC